MLPPPLGDTVELATTHAPLTVKSLSQLNVPLSPSLFGRLTRGSETLQHGAPEDAYLDIPKFKQTALGASKLYFIKGVEVYISRNSKGNNCEKLIFKRRHRGSIARRGSENMTDEMVRRLLVVSK